MQDILQKVKGWIEKIREKKSSYNISGIRPARDWKIMLLVTAVLMVLSGLIAFYFYVQVDHGVLFVTTDDIRKGDAKINIELLQKTVDEVHARADNFEKIKQGGSIPADPLY